MQNHIITPTSPEAQERLKNIEVIYTDLDGTMLAPGGRVFVNDNGEPSGQLGEAIYGLKKAGVEVVVVTGRNRNQLAEIIRLLDLSGFMGEMGTVVQYGVGDKATYSFLTGDMAYDPACGKTPHQTIEESGIVKKLIGAFPGLLEYRTPWCEGREVTHMLRGRVELAEAQAILDKGPLPLMITDNGRIKDTLTNSTLTLDKDIHVYHVQPKGCSKEVAVRTDIERRGIDRAKTAAIGDSRTDALMGRAAGVFCTVQNGLESAVLVNELVSRDEKSVATVNPTIDGWCEFARAIMQAKGVTL